MWGKRSTSWSIWKVSFVDISKWGSVGHIIGSLGGDRVTVLFEPQKQVAESEDVNTQRSIPEYPVTLICKGWKWWKWMSRWKFLLVIFVIKFEIPVGGRVWFLLWDSCDLKGLHNAEDVMIVATTRRAACIPACLEIGMTFQRKK